MNVQILKNTKIILAIIASTFLIALGVVLATRTHVFAASACTVAAFPDDTERLKCQACEGAGGTYTAAPTPADAGSCDDGSGSSADDRVSGITEKVINVFSFIVGVAAVIMIMIGGFRYVTSNGDSGSITAAKNTILYAVIGLVIVAMAQLIVRFVIGRI